MKKAYLKLIFLLVVWTGCTPDVSDTLPPSEVFIKFYGGVGKDEASSFIATDDGGFLILGHSNSRGMVNSTSTDMTVLNIGPDGNERGISSFNSPEPSVGTGDGTSDLSVKIIASSEGGYVAVFNSVYNLLVNQNITEKKDIYLLKLDDNGNIDEDIPPFIFPSGSTDINEEAADIVEVSDGFVVVGSTTAVVAKEGSSSATTADESDILLFKVDKNLAFVWEEKHGFTTVDHGVSLAALAGDRLMVVGNTSHSTTGIQAGENIFFVITDSDGAASGDATTFGDEHNDVPVAVAKVSDDDFYIAGNSTSVAGVVQPCLLRVTSGVQQSFRYMTDGPDAVTGVEVFDMIRTDQGRFLMVGQIQGLADDAIKRAQMIVSRVNGSAELDVSFGNQEFAGSQTFGGNGSDWAKAVLQLSTGQLVILSNLDIDETGNTVIALIKTNRNGLLER